MFRDRREGTPLWTLLHSGPHEVMPVPVREWVEDDEGKLRAIGPVQAISDRDYWHKQAEAAQTWSHLKEADKALIAHNWLRDGSAHQCDRCGPGHEASVVYQYLRLSDGRPLHG
jgi:hypothetical protein